jgi:hypothetical protein
MKTGVLGSYTEISRLSAVTLICWPGWIVFLGYPLPLFAANQDGFNYDIALIIPWTAAALIWTACGIGVLRISTRARMSACMTGVWVSIWLLLRDHIAPVEMTNLIGFSGHEKVAMSTSSIIYEILWLLFVMVCAWRIPIQRAMGPVALFAGSLTAAQVVTFAWQLERATWSSVWHHLGGGNADWINQEPATGSAKTGNIYHILVDSYVASSFPEAQKRAGLTDADWEGFTYYPNNWANYTVTHASVPSLMSGRFFSGGNLSEWRGSWSKDGIFRRMLDGGYAVWLYANHRHYLGQPFSHSRIFRSRSSIRRSLLFSDLVVMRLAPAFLKKHSFAENQGLATRVYIKFHPQTERWLQEPETLASPSEQVEYFRSLIRDERQRPEAGQYVYMHLYLPHAPFSLDCGCADRSPTLKTQTDYVEAYRNQAACVNKLLQELVAELKRLGRYTSSTILIHGDHGLDFYPISSPVPWTDAENDAYTKVNVFKWNWHIKFLEPVVSTLMLLKPPSIGTKPMAVSQHETQLVDVPATLYDILEWPIKTPNGVSALSPERPANRPRDVFVGYLQTQGPANKFVWFGRELHKGELNHFSWDQTRGWVVHDNLRAFWK